jgi:hypothetical protein
MRCSVFRFILHDYIFLDMSKLIFHFLVLLCSLVIISRCTRPAECELPFKTGPCRAMFPSFYFNPSTNRCEEFIYGGCNGRQK